jgi:hypothetical protein
MFENWGFVGFWTSIDWDFGLIGIPCLKINMMHAYQKIIQNSQFKHKPQHGM